MPPEGHGGGSPLVQGAAYTEVLGAAVDLRREQWYAAQEASVALGKAPPWVTPEESDLRAFVHDAESPNHEKDFHSLAAFPCALYEDMVLYVWRASSVGDLRLETIVGEQVGPSDSEVRSAHALVHRGHMRLLVPPANLEHTRRLRECRGHGLAPLQTVCSGWANALLQADPIGCVRPR